jgi:hypothetical protein
MCDAELVIGSRLIHTSICYKRLVKVKYCKVLWGLARAATLTSAGAERFPDLAHTSVLRRGRFPRPLLSFLSKTSVYYRPLFDRQIAVQSVT